MSQSTAKFPVSLISWKPFAKNSLRGFATVRLGKSLKIADCGVHSSHGRRWVGMPSKPMIDRDGAVVRDDRGKVKYVPLVEWTNKESADMFSEAVIEAVEREHPGATEADGT